MDESPGNSDSFSEPEVFNDIPENYELEMLPVGKDCIGRSVFVKFDKKW